MNATESLMLLATLGWDPGDAAWIVWVGLAAGALTTLSFVPQVLKSWRTRSTHDVSLGMFVTMCVGVALWLAYGILRRDIPMMTANGVTLLLAGSVLWMKIRNG